MEQIRDKKLFEILSSLTIKTIELLKSKPKNQIPRRPVFSFYDIKKNGYTTKEETKPSYYAFVSESKDAILSFPEYQKFSKYILNNIGIKNRSSSYELISVDRPPFYLIFSLIFCPFLEKYFQTVNAVSFLEKWFLNTYMALENFFYGKNTIYSVTSPLVGFYSIEDEIVLNENLKIKKLNEFDKSTLIRAKHSAPGLESPLDGVNIGGLFFALETTYNYNKNDVFDSTFGKDLFEKVVTALRIFKRGSTDFTCLHYAAHSWQPTYPEIYGESNNPKINERLRYSLNDEEINEFITFWNQFEKIDFKNSTYLKTAIQRLNFAIEEKDAENKIMDFSISLEALYLNANSELRFRLSNRIAILLGESDEERIGIASFIRGVYDLRSLIAHGENIYKNKKSKKIIEKYESLENILDKLEDCLRKSINAFFALSKTQKKDEIMDELDKSLLSFNSREKLALAKKL